jgi:hypothetical protein
MPGIATIGKFAIQSENTAHRQALPPVLLGLLAPILVFVLIDPRALSDASLIAQVYLFIIFLMAAAAYVISVFETGEVISVTVNKATRSIQVERIGSFAKSTMELPFADVATVRIETRYDDDGYQTAMPVIVLTTREVVPMPAGTTESDVAHMRAMLKGS